MRPQIEGDCRLYAWIVGAYIYYQMQKKLDRTEKDIAWLKRMLKNVKDHAEEMLHQDLFVRDYVDALHLPR